ncbi:Na-translocating system protein MpsC family protein [Nostoc sp. NMS8]|uniref:Na-translocating system protein MpsC family protein n=1 Tax=Nostoc sp. NMS8 TaxID=2815392 RepID=UPI0025F316CB|nr:Na-translocating system protein MpsC family protein [Nostoc sp. NMS8]
MKLERELSQRIIKFYNDRIGKPPSQIICHFFDIKIVISLENSVTQAEQSLLKGGYANLAEQARLYLEKIIKLELKSLI